MITRLVFEYFKCFRKLSLPLASLTLLSGTNASGKSTIMQALVLLHQTMSEHEWSNRLQLNGGLIQLGSAGDVIDKVHGRYELKIGVLIDNIELHWQFTCEEDKEAMSLRVANVTVQANWPPGSVTLDYPNRLHYLCPESDQEIPRTGGLPRSIRTLTYLTAERVGPRDSYQLKDPNALQVVGSRGENAVGLLYQKSDHAVIDTLLIESAPPTLFKQVEARMQNFFPGIMLQLEKVAQTNSVLLGIRTSNDTDFHRPINVGFGLTQVLPVIVAALAAEKGDLLLIENPEVHLHPSGQALIGEFLAEVAQAGIQVIVESHSDHVLNGIRRAVKSGKIDSKDVALRFFSAQRDGEVPYRSPQVASDGTIDQWPTGFFDQFDKDMNYFAGWED